MSISTVCLEKTYVKAGTKNIHSPKVFGLQAFSQSSGGELYKQATDATKPVTCGFMRAIN